MGLARSEKAGNKIIEDFWNAYPELLAQREHSLFEAREKGYVTTLGGRIINLEDSQHQRKQQMAEAECRAPSW